MKTIIAEVMLLAKEFDENNMTYQADAVDQITHAILAQIDWSKHRKPGQLEKENNALIDKNLDLNVRRNENTLANSTVLNYFINGHAPTQEQIEKLIKDRTVTQMQKISDVINLYGTQDQKTRRSQTVKSVMFEEEEKKKLKGVDNNKLKLKIQKLTSEVKNIIADIRALTQKINLPVYRDKKNQLLSAIEEKKLLVEQINDNIQILKNLLIPDTNQSKFFEPLVLTG